MHCLVGNNVGMYDFGNSGVGFGGCSKMSYVKALSRDTLFYNGWKKMTNNGKNYLTLFFQPKKGYLF